MCASWHDLYRALSAQMNRRHSEALFAEMCQGERELSSFDAIDELLSHQHDPGSDRERRHAVVKALVRTAQSSAPCRSVAATTLVLVLWPGLDAVHARLRAGFPFARSELPGEIVARVAEAILRLDLTRVARPAATLVMNVERDIRRMLIALREREANHRDIDDAGIAAAAAEMDTASSGGWSDLDEALGALSEEDRWLLRRVFLLGETQEEAGRALGLTPAAARKRYQRALALLRRSYSSPLSHSAPGLGLSPAEARGGQKRKG